MKNRQLKAVNNQSAQAILGRKKHSGNPMRNGEKTSEVIISVLVGIFVFLLIYPFVYMISVSLSDYEQVSKVIFIPRGINLKAYKAVFALDMVWRGYLNSIVYTLLTLVLNLILTVFAAYPLSKSWLPGRKILVFFVLFTMYFGGGLIPSYLVVTKLLGWKNTIWAILIPGGLSTYNVILVRTYFVSSVPNELTEAATIDGANDFQTLLKIFIPLSKPILATISLYVVVGSWNSWFGPSIYLDEEKMFPIQLVMRNALLDNIWIGGVGNKVNYKSMNYALTIAVVAPIVFTYPFCQKYFIKGIMIGSLKG